MENALHARDKVGVQDLVLLEDYQNERSVIENLRKRFNKEVIYTYIGPVLISINPYKNLSIYNQNYVEEYRNVNFYEVPPHVFAVADTAFRSMHEENRDQCILISGESGSGKTEASKKILQYIAAAIDHSTKVDNVKDKLLQSNPVLEAFGNARTNRNDNSSRFGKYMDIEFNFLGEPAGGHILNYLLEKSRVVKQSHGERNFHVFYQLLAGAEDSMLYRLQLRRDPDYYCYLNQGECPIVDGIDDSSQFDVVRRALSTIGFSQKEELALFDIVSSVLHLGNIGFSEENGQAIIALDRSVVAISQLLGCPEQVLRNALTNRTISARGELLQTPLNRDQAIYARDALAKAIYERLFTWLVRKLNSSLNTKGNSRKTLMGILDIYGFEIFQCNSFEQFCINYCNEKLQQLFIQLTLKSEQEEYCREGIQWEAVEYFNNKTICDLVEERHLGIIAVMDEECLRPGDATDMTFLAKLEQTVGDHPHFVSHSLSDSKTRKTMQREEFRLIHYAGDVTYKVTGFLDKNNDLLYRDLKNAMCHTENPITRDVFPQSELDCKKRPNTAATQFKSSLSQLMDILMSKEPSYIRCIKPNDSKRSHIFDEQIVEHQVKYLGLMENLRVRRAGFSYRRCYELFLQRYKCLCPATWPNYDGGAKNGVQELVNHLVYPQDEFRLGKTKIFIRSPQVLFRTEDAFQHRKHHLATIIQSYFRRYVASKKFQLMRNAVTQISSHWRRYQAQKLLAKRRWASQVIRGFIKGFMLRNSEICDENKRFVKRVREEYLRRLSKHLPRSVLDKSWPPCPGICTEASELLHALHTRLLVRNYCRNLSAERKLQFEQKVVAEQLFRGKKQSYPASVPRIFRNNCLNTQHKDQQKTIFEQAIKPDGEKTLYATAVTKYDRHGYKSRIRILLVTNAALYLLEDKEFKLKHRIALSNITGITVSNLSDNLLLLRIPNDMKKDKGDLILACQFLIETVTKIAMACNNLNVLSIEDSSCISHNMTSGKQGLIEFSCNNGLKPGISKTKNGSLLVIASP